MPESVDSIGELIKVHLEDEMRQSYLDYSMSVIIGRALPDIRDGLKPVHRRALFAMRELKNDYNKPYKKAARIVGDIIGKYHPHGDAAVYDAIVRMVQPFSLRYPLVDGQGNFGSVDGDAPAAMRYTEVRLARIAHELLSDLDKDTVDFVPNYDDSEREPAVLPTRVPNLLVNGSSGIAVGMATNIPPHNLSEVVNATLAYIDDPDITLEGLLEHLPGPDFPTAGLIMGRAGIYSAYSTGLGSVTMRARAEIERPKKGNELIVLTELPYRVNKALLLESIAHLVRDKKLAGISDLRDESDKDGMRIVITVKSGENSDVVLNNLYRHTQMQSTFGVNLVALSEGSPIQFTLKKALESFVAHRREAVTRRSVFDLRKAREKAHNLEGLAVALANIDEVVALIRASKTPADARRALLEKPWAPGAVSGMLERAGPGDARVVDLTRLPELPEKLGLQPDGYHLSPAQVQAILELRLHRLTALEQEKIVKDYESLVAEITDLLDILSNPDRMLAVVRSELEEVREQFGDERRTEILEQEDELLPEDLIKPEEVIGTLSFKGYVKTQSMDVYGVQHRGGKGKIAASLAEDDFIHKVFTANTHDTMLCFSNRGKVYWTKVHRLARGSRTARGKPLVQLFESMSEGEKIVAMLPVKEWRDDMYVVFATARGKVKKTLLNKYSRQRVTGIIALKLGEDDELIDAELLTDGDHIMLCASHGRSVRFDQSNVREMGRTAAGVRGIRLPADEKVVSLICLDAKAQAEAKILIATENGFGKRTLVEAFPTKGRGGKGVIAIKVGGRNGSVVQALRVMDGDELMLISSLGKLIRLKADRVFLSGRNTMGGRLVRLSEGSRLIDITAIDEAYAQVAEAPEESDEEPIEADAPDEQGAADE